MHFLLRRISCEDAHNSSSMIASCWPSAMIYAAYVLHVLVHEIVVLGERLAADDGKSIYTKKTKEQNDDSLHRIQELQTLLMENSQQKERLTGFMAQGYIDQILYNEEMNTLLAQADRYNTEIEMLSKSVKGDACQIQAATTLLRFTEKSSMLDSFDDELFEETVSCVRVLSREKIAFELKCGLTLTERM